MLPLSESSRVKEGVWDRFWACKTPFARIKNERRIKCRMIKKMKLELQVGRNFGRKEDSE
jgi:hypothetical protein